MAKRRIIVSLFLSASFLFSFGQEIEDSTSVTYEGINFNVGHNRILSLSFLNQVWIRYSALNPGSTIFGDPKSHLFDIGLRRTRIVMSGSPFDRVTVFVQMGMNNFSYLSEREAGFFFHDAVADYKLIPQKLSVGTGLTAWGGFSRFSSPSVGSILGVDAPLFAQATNGATDQFLRKLSLYTKGDWGNLYYNLALSKPMAIQNSGQNRNVDTFSTYSQLTSTEQLHGYIQYSFWNTETHTTPYTKGTYMGTKKLLNLGGGFLYQPSAMQIVKPSGDTSYTKLLILALDVFFELPLKHYGAINFYTGYFRYDFGKKYLRNVGAMNPANGSTDLSILNGGGTSFPMIGTGSIGYIQGGYLFPSKDKNQTRFMPYSIIMMADFDALDQYMLYFDVGLNLFLQGHRVKFTLAMQNRPVFKNNLDGTNFISSRKNVVIGQFQVNF